MPVLKQTSPTGADASVWAPNPRPQNTEPSARTSAAVAPCGTSFGSARGGGSEWGAVGPPDRSRRVRPVAVMTAAQWRAGMDPAWRHFRTASVPTPVRRAAGSGPARRASNDSTLAVMVDNLWEEISQHNRCARFWEISSGKHIRATFACHFAYYRGTNF